MAFQIINADITKLNVEAIVNPTDQYYSGDGGVDMQLYDICGQALRDATDKLPKLHLGEAKATESFGLPCKYIIHTSGPHWTGRTSLETAVLGSCYRNSLVIANSLGCKSIAFPLIASRGKHFPKEVALTVAINAIEECVQEFPNIDIVLAVFGTWTERLPSELFTAVSQYISDSFVPDDDYVDEFTSETFLHASRKINTRRSCNLVAVEESCDAMYSMASIDEDLIKNLIDKPTQSNLDKIPVDESFGAMLTRLLQERNLPHSAVQDEIGMSTPGFWKLLNGKSNPTKMTVFGIAIALELSIDETKEMLMKAGYAINQSSVQDVIVAGLIQSKIYDRNTIDDLLYSLDLQPLPGA